MDPSTIIIALVTLIIGAVVGYFSSKKSVDKQNQELIDEATRKAQAIINEAEKEGEATKKEKILQAKEKFLELKSKHEEVVNQRERKISDAEHKVKEREDRIKSDLSEIQKQRDIIKSEKGNLQARIDKLNIKQKEVDTMHKKQVEILEKISNYSAEEARAELIEVLKDEAKAKAQALCIKNLYITFNLFILNILTLN